jgi:hypothetical protein
MNLNYFNAIASLAPNAKFSVRDEDYNSIQWFSPEIEKPPESAVAAAYAQQASQEPLNAVKDQAKVRIAASDWAVLPDVGLSNSAEYVTYRAALRELIKNPTLDPVYPTEPQPIWI